MEWTVSFPCDLLDLNIWITIEEDTIEKSNSDAWHYEQENVAACTVVDYSCPWMIVSSAFSVFTDNADDTIIHGQE